MNKKIPVLNHSRGLPKQPENHSPYYSRGHLTSYPKFLYYT